MAVYGYLRVSTKEQNSQYQRNMLLNYANENTYVPITFIDETMSGAKSYRNRALGSLLDKLTCGDILLVNEFSRLGRSLLDILEIIKVINEREAKLIIVRDNLKIGDDMNSKLLTTMFGIVSEIERDLLKSRVKEGLENAKVKGVKLGRKPGPAKSKLDPHKDLIQEYLDKEISKASISKLLGVNKQTLYSFIKKYKMEKSRFS
jgi:DNA invertase Pin-like site-specific DNA recombinase